MTGLIAFTLGVPGRSFAQDAGQTGQEPARRQPRPAGRGAALPPLGRGMDAPALQANLDAWVLVQAVRELKLNGDQYPNFVAKLSRLQNVRRRVTMERRRLFGELRVLLDSPTPKDEAIVEKLRAIED